MKKLFIETYGCQMNVADSEVVASVMRMAGYETCETLDEADAVFLNTCSVRDNAEQKIINRLEALHALRRKGRHLIIGVLGCMAERVKEELIENHHVDVVAGPDAYLSLPDLIAQVELGHKAINVELSVTETYKDVIPQRVCGSHISGFVSIMRGCNNFCHYCIVPYTRGRERSRDVESILNEVRDLKKRGYREVTLLGQNVNSYLHEGADDCFFSGTFAVGGTRGRRDARAFHHFPSEGHERRHVACHCGRTQCVPAYPFAGAERKQPYLEIDEPQVHP